jgi:hypothetical protein
MVIVIATVRPARLLSFAQALAQETGAAVHFEDRWSRVLASAKAEPPALVVLDEGLVEGGPMELARQLAHVNALIGTAAVTPLSPTVFHQESEGLGILAPVPVEPSGQDGTDLAKALLRLGLAADDRERCNSGR